MVVSASLALLLQVSSSGSSARHQAAAAAAAEVVGNCLAAVRHGEQYRAPASVRSPHAATAAARWPLPDPENSPVFSGIENPTTFYKLNRGRPRSRRLEAAELL